MFHKMGCVMIIPGVFCKMADVRKQSGNEMTEVNKMTKKTEGKEMQSLLNVPAEVVSAIINAAVAKAAAKKRRIFVLGIMAGAFIAMGAQSSSLAVHNITDVGIARTPCRMYFPSGGLMMIVFVGGELFTGDCMMSMACMKGRIGFGSLLRTVYLGILQERC